MNWISVLLKLLPSLLRLADNLKNLPDDWEDAAKVEEWLNGAPVPLAQIVAVLVAEFGQDEDDDNLMKLRRVKHDVSAAIARKVAEDPEGLDFDGLVDLVASVLCLLFPAHATAIRQIAAWIKELA